MKIRNILNTDRFRFVLFTAVIFGVLAAVLSFFVFYGLRDSLEEQLRDFIETETRQLLGDYADSGLDELHHDIAERLERSPSPRLYYTLSNPDGVLVFDRIVLPRSEGWSRTTRDGKPDLLLYTTDLNDGYRMGIGAENRSAYEFEKAYGHTIIWFFTTMLILSLIAGLLISRRFLSRVEQFEKTANAIGSGSLSTRISLQGVDGDFEQLAKTVNRMLDKIEQLMNEVRYASSSIAHDLRTPLTRLRPRLEQIATLQPEAKAKTLSQETLEQLDGILSTFASILKLGELESAGFQIHLKPVNLSDLMDHIVSTYHPSAEDNGQTLIYGRTQNVVVEGDSQLLMQMFANLIENAINHNPPGTAIQIELTEKDNGVEAIVADNGRGIPEDLLNDVLKPYYKVDSSRKMRGSGLGLSLVRSIAVHHHATLTLENNQPGLCAKIHFSQDSRDGINSSLKPQY